MRTTLVIDDDVLRAAKKRARRERETAARLQTSPACRSRLSAICGIDHVQIERERANKPSGTNWVARRNTHTLAR